MDSIYILWNWSIPQWLLHDIKKEHEEVNAATASHTELLLQAQHYWQMLMSTYQNVGKLSHIPCTDSQLKRQEPPDDNVKAMLIGQTQKWTDKYMNWPNRLRRTTKLGTIFYPALMSGISNLQWRLEWLHIVLFPLLNYFLNQIKHNIHLK